MDLLKHFLVFRCAGCDEAIPAGRVLCEDCEEAFRRECTSPCKHCHAKHIECGCFANGRKSPADRVLHLSPYRRAGVTHNMIRLCKSTKDKYLTSFISALLASEIERKLSPAPTAVLVPMPRSYAAYIKNGFDQSKTVGKEIASALGIGYCEALINNGKKMQKLLGYRGRLKNAKKAFVLDQSATDIRGKRVILYDDITTTGASATACIKLLRDAGAVGVDFVSFARTER